MNGLLLVGVVLTVFIAGVVVADFIGPQLPQGVPLDALGTKYNYEFTLIDGGTCDLHWLRPRLYYEMGRYPDQLTLIYPDLTIGFESPLTRAELILLNDSMSNNVTSQEYCNVPSTIYYRMTTEIHPKAFENSIGARNAPKPLYYADGLGNLTLLFIEPLTVNQKDDIKDELRIMWREQV